MAQLNFSINTDTTPGTISVYAAGFCDNWPTDDSHAMPIFGLTATGQVGKTFELTDVQPSPLVYSLDGMGNPTTDQNNPDEQYIFIGENPIDCLQMFNPDILVTAINTNLFDIDGSNDWSTANGTIDTFLANSTFSVTNTLCSTNFSGGFLSFINFSPPIDLGDILNAPSLVIDLTVLMPLDFGASISSTICCILPGADVKTHNGFKKIEELKRGDIVFDKDGNKVPIVNNAEVSINRSQVKYVTIKRDSLGENIPSGDLSIVENHPILINNEERLVQDLVNDNNGIIYESKNVPYVYMPITSKRTFIMINNIPVCTYEHNDFKQFTDRMIQQGKSLKYNLH